MRVEFGPTHGHQHFLLDIRNILKPCIWCQDKDRRRRRAKEQDRSRSRKRKRRHPKDDAADDHKDDTGGNDASDKVS